MRIRDWLSNLLSKNNNAVSLDVKCGELSGEIFYKKLAIEACVNLIANAIAKGEFQTFQKGKQTRGGDYYLLNVEPNRNKCANKFWRDVVHKLVYENECLVIQQDDQLYVADSFTKEEKVFVDTIYSGIQIGDYQLRDTFRERDVYHFEMHNKPMKLIIDGLYESYSKLIAASMKEYKRSKHKRAKLIIPTGFTQTEKGQKELDKLMNERLKKFFNADGDAVLPLTNGIGYEEITAQNQNRGASSNKDTRSFIDDVFDFVAIGFQVPPQLLRSNVVDTGNAMNTFLTLCVNPIADLITSEINRKMYGREKFLENTYTKLDTSKIKVSDLKDVANALDVLTRIGAYTIDDSLKELGMEPINEWWSKVRFMTKNYTPIEQMVKGGEGN